MKACLPSRAKIFRSRGFSLVEILVAAAVFSLLLLALLAISDGANSLTSLTRRNIDSASKLRAAFDRLSTDLENAVTRPDSPFYLVSEAENQELHFLTRVDGYDGGRPIAVVRYRIRAVPNLRENGTTVYLLERSAEGISLSDSSSRDALPANSTGDYDILAEGVFRLAVEVFDANGSLVAPSTENGSIPWAQAKTIIVSMAALDDRAGEILPDTDWVSHLPGNDFEEWARKIDVLDFAGLPPAAAQGIQARRKVLFVPGGAEH